MNVDAMTVHIPHALVTRLAERAMRTQRTVEEELIEVLALAVPLDDAPLPTDVVAVVASLDAMDDDALWELARSSHLSPVAAAHLAELNQKDQRAGLSAEEQHIADALVEQYEHTLLIRAEAMARLKEHGKDISSLLEPVSV